MNDEIEKYASVGSNHFLWACYLKAIMSLFLVNKNVKINIKIFFQGKLPLEEQAVSLLYVLFFFFN